MERQSSQQYRKYEVVNNDIEFRTENIRDMLARNTSKTMRTTYCLVTILCLLFGNIFRTTEAFTTTAFTAIGRNDARISSYDTHYTHTRASTTFLAAIGVLARKAKEADVRKYCETDLEESTLEMVKQMKLKLEEQEENDSTTSLTTIGPVQTALTKRKGTITVVAEYKRKFAVEAGFAGDEIFEPHILSPTFREYGAAAISVLADARMGGSNYDDLQSFVEENRAAGERGEMPGPLPIICNDLIVDEVQIARSAARGASAVVIQMGMLTKEKVDFFHKCATALEMETIVAVSSKKEAQMAVDLDITLLYVVGVENIDERFSVVQDLNLPSEDTKICTIANIAANNDKKLEEIEEAWVCRDKGFNSVWISDALYKSGNDPTEHAGPILRSMTAKSSVKWASAKSMHGRGEGAKEYLGDILM